MARVQLKLDGFEELKFQLRQLPAHLTAQGQEIVDRRTKNAAMQILQGYAPHRVTGNLAAGLEVELGAKGRYIAASRVVNRAPHAYLFEHGSVERFDPTRRGAARGEMTAFNIFIPIVMREREAMWGELALMAVREGLEVSGSAAA